METVFSQVVIEADIPRRDAVVQAFKVGRVLFLHSIRLRTHYSMHGTRMVCPVTVLRSWLFLIYFAEQHAMGCDEYHPLTNKGSNLTDSGGIGYTIIDAVDTMWLMGLNDEYSRARDWIEAELTFDRDGNYNTFEVYPFIAIYNLTLTLINP